MLSKLISNGYGYMIDKNLSKIYWKCDDKNCTGRGNSSSDFKPPLILTQCHSLWHEPLLVKREIDECIQQFKLSVASTQKGMKTRHILKDILKDKSDDVLSEIPSLNALRQRANRIRKSNKHVNKEPKFLKDLIINDNFKKSYKGEDFLLGEAGKDNERVFLFSTPKNIKLLSSNSSWMGDGTFAVLPLIFLQLYLQFCNYIQFW